jgi:hypothetical protein
MGGTSHRVGRPGSRILGPSMSGVLYAYLALWLSLFPVFQAAHLAFADHAHCFCHEHLRIEDVPRRELWRSQAEQWLGPDSRRRSVLASRPQTNNPPDSLLNFSLSRDPVLLAAGPVAVQLADVIPTSGPAQLEGSAPQPLLLLAPKTSPPLVASL